MLSATRLNGQLLLTFIVYCYLTTKVPVCDVSGKSHVNWQDTVSCGCPLNFDCEAIWMI